MIEIGDNVIRQECGICNHITHIKLTDDELEAYRGYLAGGGPIQECLPTLNKVEGEFLKSRTTRYLPLSNEYVGAIDGVKSLTILH